MTIKSLVIGLGNSSSAGNALDYAINLARQSEAQLTGLHVNQPMMEEPQIQAWISEDMLSMLGEANSKAITELQQGFESKTSNAGMASSSSFILEEGYVDEHLATFTRFHDMLVIGRTDQKGQASHTSLRAENIVTRAGRPVLMVPSECCYKESEGRAIAVAWDGSRAAARALADALHLYGSDYRYDVISVLPTARSQPSTVQQGRDILDFLSSHGAETNLVRLVADKHSVASTLLRYVELEKPSLLVMGSGGHKRLRDEVFGGVTRQLLERACIPIFMAN